MRWSAAYAPSNRISVGMPASRGVTIEAQYTVGEYDILILSAKESDGLELWLRERGYERVIAVGNSGGGTLYAFYQAQAVTLPPGRFVDTPAGEPCDLNACVLPALDGMVHIATHLGQGKLMLDNIDPSVVDETDPLSVDPSLDMYNPDNGFRVPPK